MIIDNKRALAYIAQIDEIRPIPNYDRVEHARIGGWWVIVSKTDNFQPGDKCVYFEVDSKCPAEDERFAFLEKRNYKIKTLKMCKVFSQGLIMPLSSFPEFKNLDINTDVTEKLGVTYALEEDNKRKAANTNKQKYAAMAQRRPDIFKRPWARWLMRREWGRKIMFLFFGKKKDKPLAFPTHFPFVHKTDQERIENMVWVLEDKTPYIKTQKCDGTSGTYILERKSKNKFEFYVCSRNIRQKTPEQKCFYGENNYYWDVAIKYDIENKLKDYLINNPKIKYVCWQGEICGPNIQKNPHNLSTLHFYCFHMTDSEQGRFNILKAAEIWKHYHMEIVPIVETNYILPDNLEDFKLEADGFYSPLVCEGDEHCAREGFVYYNTKDPNMSFKNVSRQYLLKH